MTQEEIKETVANSLEFSNKLLREVELLEIKHPYHLNIIDELHINENAHSRILCKLLQYRADNGCYEFLQSLLSFINEKYQRDDSKDFFSKVHINNPTITQEVERIDLWVKEKGKYAIIFENKVCGATDQDTQLCRYIEKTKRLDFSDNQIYIIYLPPTKECDPSDYTWGEGHNGTTLKKDYENRFFKTPYKEDILPWLEDYVLPNIRNKDVMLLSAVTQYIDYLKGYLFSRNTNNMNNEEKQVVDTILGITNYNNEDRSKALEKKISELQNASNYLSAYLTEVNDEIFKEKKRAWKDQISKDFPEFQYCEYGYGGVYLVLDGTRYALYFSADNRWYCQLQFDESVPDNSRVINNDTINKYGIREILWLPQNYQGDKIWKYFSAEGENDAYQCMKEVVEIIKANSTKQ